MTQAARYMMAMTSPPKIIGLCGLIGSGKTALAAEIQRKYGYHRRAFAQPLKSMLETLGLDFDYLYGDRKEEPHALLGGRTARHAMQTLGTEWGRNLIHPDIWVNAWQKQVEKALAPGVPGIVADDCRFPNEAKVVRAMGGEIWQISRPESIEEAWRKVNTGKDLIPHPSEQLQFRPDLLIDNSGTIEDLLRRALPW